MLIIHLEEYEENYFDGENMKNKRKLILIASLHLYVF